MSEPADADLLARMVKGDESAFAAILDRYEKRLYHRFLRVFRDREEAADLTQQAFLVLIRSPEACSPERGSLGTFLFGVARILTLKRLRQIRRQRMPEVSGSPASDPGPLEEVLRREKEEAVLAGIGRLAPLRRQALLLREVEGLGISEIARTLGLPENTAKSHLRRARIELRDWLSRRLSAGGEKG